MAGPATLRPLPLRLLLDEAIRRGRRHFGQTYLPVAVPIAVASGLFALAPQGWTSPQTLGGPPSPADAIVSAGVTLAAAALFFLLYSLGYAVLFAGAVDAVAGRPVSMKRAWRTIVGPRALGTLFLKWLSVAAGFLCCLLPGVYLGMVFSLVLPAMVEEGIFGAAALRRSAELARYNPRRALAEDPRIKAFVISFVGWLLGLTLGFLIQLPMQVIVQVFLFRSIAGGARPDPAAMMASLQWLQVPTNMLSMLAQTAVSLYVSFGLALLYFDVRGRKEGMDIEQALDALSGKRPSAEALPAAPPG